MITTFIFVATGIILYFKKENLNHLVILIVLGLVVPILGGYFIHKNLTYYKEINQKELITSKENLFKNGEPNFKTQTINSEIYYIFNYTNKDNIKKFISIESELTDIVSEKRSNVVLVTFKRTMKQGYNWLYAFFFINTHQYKYKIKIPIL